jgi:hypothetical protein
MKTKLILLTLLLFPVIVFGQVKFEKGYIIDNDGKKFDCLIKNNQWKNSPSNIDYKLNENDEVTKISYHQLKEFGIAGVVKYIKVVTNIDRSSNEANKLTFERNPVWNQEELLLKVLIEGKASLYYYESGGLKRYFYSFADSAVSQLVYKRYKIDRGDLNIINDGNFGLSTSRSGSIGGDYLAENNDFRSQLWDNLKCEDIYNSTLKKLKYSENDLKGFFKTYNECSQNSFTDYSMSNRGKVTFNMKIAPGLFFSSLSDARGIISAKENFTNKPGYRIGIESELVTPFNRNKWSLLFEPNFLYYQLGDYEEDSSTPANYSAIEFPVGARYYMFLNDNSRLFFDALFNPNFSINFNPGIENLGAGYKTTSNTSFLLGAGYDFKKYSLELRYYSKRELLNNYPFWSFRSSGLQLIFRYRLFTTK